MTPRRQPACGWRRPGGKIPARESAIPRPELKKYWAPSEGSFRRLLAWLDAGVDSGGERYLDMRRRLSAYFDRRGCRAADDLADETLNRIARRLEEEGSIDDGPPGRYCYIVAKFVFLEYVRRARREGRLEAVDEQTPKSTVSAQADDGRLGERLHSALERCLGLLAPPDRELILEYYGGGDQRNAERRRALAARLGVTVNALAIRACRIRERLEGCVRSHEGEP